ncbi:PadR family transcriptional regulator [Aetokthonos hydrillicola Thurmond2011]|jgi:DNA-binding PadR family transcriptional regulator|uniref:PadR family transcriptional regulator n=1 Tax=Aetokthonos hydrillicola Thurmond2011 TaxID=2712845 RepID=A0AAP5I8T1_9CYAN|nr:PadR family transcriptional regulator [Aetokthonos hydrillicola]MBO3463846.1 PadR family transcriptional regulator [Aetokthonos hydrillicola CCALA 1050]MBW4589897.1 PadR family transcriptional regulator [Aetokthonos hydrillicola CCALA 1050]MDR9896981.1 PadR family transcriptional regulator [Aetokthonos hydrillicola Thurmond2011]
MFKPFHLRFPVPVHAGEEFAHPFFMSGRHGHRGSFGGDWGDEPRTRRGDIKFMLLGLLSERPQHGYELIKELENRRGGFRRLSPGSVYPTLQMLEEGGYLTSEQVDGKRVYTITEAGRQLLRDRHPQPNSRNTYDSVTENKPSGLIELRRTLTELNDLVTQVARSGNSAQANRVRDLLVQVKREIYKFLAED